MVRKGPEERCLPHRKPLIYTPALQTMCTTAAFVAVPCTLTVLYCYKDYATIFDAVHVRFAKLLLFSLLELIQVAALGLREAKTSEIFLLA